MSKRTSPFKFLDSYQQEDIEVFFGREEETEALYDALSGVKHLLVYGPSGAGKTSLIECGLRNEFSDADWFALSIRRGSNMVAAVFASINNELREPFEIDLTTQLPKDETITFGPAIERLFSECYQPVYLLFDQFEELLISGSEEEKKDFFNRLHELIRYKVPCRVLLIMREEFIGHLSEFEPLCPSIFQHRFRLEKMRRSAVQGVIFNILNAPRYQSYFQVNDSQLLAENILKKLPDQKQEIELAHVQVFLSELWDRAIEENIENKKPLLHQGLIKENDNLTTVLDSFLKKQLTELESDHGDKAPLELLAAMISEKHTKLQLSEKELQEKLDDESVELKLPLIDLSNEFKERRILRQIKSDGETQYEISHDVLALVVGGNLTEEMRMREKAAEVYRVYEGREGYFSQDDLDYVRAFKKFKLYPSNLENRILKSEQYLVEQQQIELDQTRRRIRTLQLFLVAAILALMVAGWQYWEAEKATEEMEIEKNRAINSDSLTQVAYKSLGVALQKAQQTEALWVNSEVDDILRRATKLKRRYPKNYQNMILECIHKLEKYPDNPTLQARKKDIQNNY